MRIKTESDEERTERYADNQHKAQLTNHKEALMPLEKLKKKIAKELSVKESYPYDWLVRTHRLYVGADHTVTKPYDVPYSPWPGNRFTKSEGVERVIRHSHTIPLRDYWRLGLQGRGV